MNYNNTWLVEKFKSKEKLNTCSFGDITLQKMEV